MVFSQRTPTKEATSLNEVNNNNKKKKKNNNNKIK